MACTKEAELWTSKEAYEAKEAPRSAFTVKNGEASFWGLAAGNTYYIRETKFPTNGNYGTANGIIVVKLDNEGAATFDVIAEADSEESGLSAGFTVHGFKIDVENHAAYLIATNSKDDYGIGLYVPNVELFLAGRNAYNASKDSFDGACNYVAPINTLKLVSFEPLEYSYLMATGSVNEIREIFKVNKDFTTNASLG